MESIVIIGGGGTGAALAHDLSLRGFTVSVFEKGELFSGATGRHHGLLHSGARYAVHDQEAARECVRENHILRKIVPQALEKNDGLFVAVTDEDQVYSKTLIEACHACNIPIKELTVAQVLDLEPALSKDTILAVQVPDATIDAWRLPMHFVATAQSNGAKFNPFSEVIGIDARNGNVVGIEVFHHPTEQKRQIGCDMVINATGAWAGNIAGFAGIDVPIQPGPGVIVAIEQRVTNMILNRMHPAGEGDIIVPQRGLSILGTSLWLSDTPETLDLPKDHIERIIENCSQMVPEIKNIPVRSVWSAARPLVKSDDTSKPQQISRTFQCYDHEETHSIEGFISIIGGKATTLRAMAEKTSDLVCKKVGRSIECKTQETMLLPYRGAYH